MQHLLHCKVLVAVVNSHADGSTYHVVAAKLSGNWRALGWRSLKHRAMNATLADMILKTSAVTCKSWLHSAIASWIAMLMYTAVDRSMNGGWADSILSSHRWSLRQVHGALAFLFRRLVSRKGLDPTSTKAEAEWAKSDQSIGNDKINIRNEKLTSFLCNDYLL